MEVIPLGPLGRAARFVALAGGLAFTLVPVLWVASLALRPAGAVTFPVSLLPPSLTLENLRTILFTDLGIGPRPYLNAAFYGISCGGITAIISLMGGHALVRYDLAFGRALLLRFLALNFLPAAARLIPLFLLYVQLGLYDTQVGVILAYVAGITPLGIWLMAGKIPQIPIRLRQAQRLDGRGPPARAIRNLLPTAQPGGGRGPPRAP